MIMAFEMHCNNRRTNTEVTNIEIRKVTTIKIRKGLNAKEYLLPKVMNRKL